MNISIIIPNFNGVSTLKANIPSVISALLHCIKLKKIKGEIILVDDGSIDDSVAVIETIQEANKDLSIKLLKQEKNLGFSSTVNKGVLESKYDIVVLLNTDVKPEIDFLIPLLGHFVDEEVFAVGCMDKSIEGGKVVMRGRGLGKWIRGFLNHTRGDIDKSETLWVSGGSSAFRKSIWARLGGMYEIYNPFYWEDLDLSYRALKAGYKVNFENKSIVSHFHEKGVIKNLYKPSRVKIVSYTNQIIFAWINMTDTDIIFTHFSLIPYHLFLALVHRDIYFILGFFNAAINLGKIVNLRKQTQNFVVKTDREVIQSISG